VGGWLRLRRTGKRGILGRLRLTKALHCVR
jgi:hypothetical protein